MLIVPNFEKVNLHKNIISHKQKTEILMGISFNTVLISNVISNSRIEIRNPYTGKTFTIPISCTKPIGWNKEDAPQNFLEFIRETSKCLWCDNKILDECGDYAIICQDANHKYYYGINYLGNKKDKVILTLNVKKFFSAILTLTDSKGEIIVQEEQKYSTNNITDFANEIDRLKNLSAFL